jgi:ABC-2 type transport system permease protein
MNRFAALFVKELRTYLGAPSFYLMTALFLLVGGYGFGWSPATYLESSLEGFLSWTGFFLLFLGPALTVRLLAEEEKMGTLELLLTSPVKDWEVVFGKYLAALAVFFLMLVGSFYFPLLLIGFGHPDAGPILSGYLGLFLLGAVVLAIGLFSSSLTANPILAYVLAGALVLFFWFIGLAGSSSGQGTQMVLQTVSLSYYFPAFSRGLIETNALIYYLSLTAVFLFLTLRAVESRRWR